MLGAAIGKVTGASAYSVSRSFMTSFNTGSFCSVIIKKGVFFQNIFISKTGSSKKTKLANRLPLSFAIIFFCSSSEISSAYSSNTNFMVLVGVLNSTTAETLSRKGLAILESCWVITHTLMPECRAEKPSFTSSPVRPLTSFDAAQSSSTIRVLVPSKVKLSNFSQLSTSCCWQMMGKKRGSFSANLYSVRLRAKVGHISTM